MDGMIRPQFRLRDLMFGVTVVAIAAAFVAYLRPEHPVLILTTMLGFPLAMTVARVVLAGRPQWLRGTCIAACCVLYLSILVALKAGNYLRE